MQDFAILFYIVAPGLIHPAGEHHFKNSKLRCETTVPHGVLIIYWNTEYSDVFEYLYIINCRPNLQAELILGTVSPPLGARALCLIVTIALRSNLPMGTKFVFCVKLLFTK